VQESAAMIDVDDAVEEIKRMINEDPTITGAKYVLVYAQKKGFLRWKKEEIHLNGHVKNEIERKKIEELATHSAAGRPIINDLEVSSGDK
jgi:hypothetical protein